MLKNPFKKISIANEYQTLVNEINSLESKFKVLDDTEIRLKSTQLRKQYQVTSDLTSITAEAFALTEGVVKFDHKDKRHKRVNIIV